MCKPKSIKIPKRFIVDISKLSPQQRNQYLMIRSWSIKRANRYAYLVTHPDYLSAKQLNKLSMTLNQGRSIILASGY